MGGGGGLCCAMHDRSHLNRCVYLCPQSDAFVHKRCVHFRAATQCDDRVLRKPAVLPCSILPWPIAQYAEGDTALIDTKNGWQAARAHANSISAMMQAQHGCGLYCAEPIAYGVGSTTLVWATPSATQNEQSILGAAAAPNRTAVIYVQVSGMNA